MTWRERAELLAQSNILEHRWQVDALARLDEGTVVDRLYYRAQKPESSDEDASYKPRLVSNREAFDRLTAPRFQNVKHPGRAPSVPRARHKPRSWAWVERRMQTHVAVRERLPCADGMATSPVTASAAQEETSQNRNLLEELATLSSSPPSPQAVSRSGTKNFRQATSSSIAWDASANDGSVLSLIDDGSPRSMGGAVGQAMASPVCSAHAQRKDFVCCSACHQTFDVKIDDAICKARAMLWQELKSGSEVTLIRVVSESLRMPEWKVKMAMRDADPRSQQTVFARLYEPSKIAARREWRSPDLK